MISTTATATADKLTETTEPVSRPGPKPPAQLDRFGVDG